MLDGVTQTECVTTDDKFVQSDTEKASLIDATTQTESIPEECVTKKSESPGNSKIDDEDSYFCVKVIAEAMKRLSPTKKAKAKLHMISYMFELEQS